MIMMITMMMMMMMMTMMMRTIRFAWLSVVRQPVRSGLGILGVAAVGALLFDMLLLSRGLVVSFGDLLARGGFDVRVLATDAEPFSGPRLTRASALARAVAGLPEVDAVQQVRVLDADLPRQPSGDDAGRDGASSSRRVAFVGAEGGVRSYWTIVQGHDLETGAAASIVVNRHLAATRALAPGQRVSLRGRCGDGPDVRPAAAFTVVGVADFPFDAASADTVAGTLEGAARLCGETGRGRADMLLVRSRAAAGADAAAAAIGRRFPALHVVTNEQIVEQFSRVEFSYFRQMSAVLATVTMFFGFLLISALLTVSVNQHLAEIATLRAVGLTRQRVVAGIVCESVMLVGAGGVLGVPLGAVVSVWLDRILRGLPGVPAELHFFVFEPRALVLQAILLAVAALAAAAYPIKIVATLPIAETLRRETVS